VSRPALDQVNAKKTDARPPRLEGNAEVAGAQTYRGGIVRQPILWIILAASVLYGATPYLTGNILLRESLILAAVYVILATNLNLVIGYTGYVNFGNIVFFGLGGYIGLDLVLRFGWHLFAAAVAAGCIVSLAALALGSVILRLRGAYFALATIGINEAVKALVSNLEVWGGATGLYLSLDAYKPLGGPADALWIVYGATVLIMALSLLLSLRIKRSKLGLGLLAIREDEDAAAVLGVRTPRYKMMAYAISAFLPAVAGALYFFKSGVILPDQAFDLTMSTEAIVTLMLGGQGTVVGPAIGALVYSELRGYLLTTAAFSNFQLVIAGALLLTVVLFAPGGLMGVLYRWLPRLRRMLP
jgi:branched-chain amino acid transport system permease protein